MFPPSFAHIAKAIIKNTIFVRNPERGGDGVDSPIPAGYIYQVVIWGGACLLKGYGCNHEAGMSARHPQVLAR